MADASMDIEINADGSAAVDALDSVNSSFSAIADTHEMIKSKFSESFQHVGVHIFGLELLNMAGLSANARVVLSALNVAVSEASAAMGLAAGPIGMAVTAVAALAAIIYEVVKAEDKHKQSLDAIIQSTTQDIGKSSDLYNQLQALKSASGSLSPALADLSHATLMLYNAQKDLLTLELKQKIIDLNDEIEKSTERSYDHGKSMEEQDLAFRKLHADLAMAKANLAALGKGYTDVSDQIKKTTEAIKSNQTAAAQVETVYNDVKTAAVAASQQMVAGFSGATAKMIIESKTFDAAFKGVIASIEETFISAVEQMLIKWAIFQAVTGIFGGGGIAANAVLGTAFAGGHATGGSGMVTEPTLFLAGEAGPEHYSFAPSGAESAGAGAGPSQQVFNLGPIQIQGINDPRQIADQVGNELVKRIRGRGDIGFLRSS